MLAIRMQRTGRSGHSQFRVIVQDSRAHPKSGRIVKYLGSYNPHTKTAALKTDEINQYLKNGAQPSERVVKLLKNEGVKVPKWAVDVSKNKRAIKNPEKLRRNRPTEASEPKPAEEAAAEAPAETPAEAPVPTEEAVAAETSPEPASAPEAQPEASAERAAEPEAPKES